MKVLLCNDTATKGHIGCQAVSNAHARMLGRLGHRVHKRFFVNELRPEARGGFSDAVTYLERNEEFLFALSEVDAVVVNGEGTIHHGGGMELLAALHIAKKRGRVALLVNCLFQEVDVDPNVVNEFDYFSVRERRSYEYAISRGMRCIQQFDSIIAADFSGKSTGIGFKVVVTDWTKSSDPLVGETSARLLNEKAAAGVPVALFPLHHSRARREWSSAVASLAEVKAVVTSRHHGIYLAILAGAPVIALQGNTWKAQSLLESFRAPLALCTTYEAMTSQLKALDPIKEAIAVVREQLLEAGDLQHFSILGKGSDTSGELEEVERLAADITSRPTLLRRDAEIIESRRKKEKGWTRAVRPKGFWGRWST